eukprot:CAMPEP_0115852766 /NCGR_PEP_ID=MMETSP0287-20121206/13163_1 /TAXON_ID=412157 /ORGANISM="Chrysochromulina rotalis, Strain UIO044" /LENGTH=250 /DNA_ID=CAMNT_0003306833 /DNA_START=47 /DNA_END=799 /DNA_ORIENTATION=-
MLLHANGILPSLGGRLIPAAVVASAQRHADPRAVALTSFASEAAGLFGNMGGASAFIAGGLVPLATFAAPQVAKDDTPTARKLKSLHALLATCSLISLLISVMYSTVSTNKLREAYVAPTSSVKALLVEGEYALPWVGCNAHFVLGLFGFAATTGLNVWLTYGRGVGTAAGCLVTSALLLMLSIVNDAVASSDPTGIRVGSSVLSLLSRYASLLFTSMMIKRRVMVAASLAFGAAGTALSAKALFSDRAE